MQPTSFASDELEASVLSILVDADTARGGAASLLTALAPVLDDAACAIAARDRDGQTLHMLAEQGEPRQWPLRLDARAAISAQSAVDAATGVMAVPLRSEGRVVGALLIGDARHAASLLRDGALDRVVDAAGAVLGALLARTDVEIRRRAAAMRSIEAIIQGMAHQMANPLTGASAMSQLLAEEATESQRGSVEQIRHELGRAFGVLRDILEFQRDTRAQDGVVDLNTVVERVIRFRGYAIRELGIALDLETTTAFVPVRCDLRALEHAILLALRYAELQSHGTVNRSIGIRVIERANGEVAIEITDSGAGVVPELSPAFFDLPLRADAAAPDAAPDLGLVASILRGCGGQLEARGSKTDGTTLALVLQRSTTSSGNTPPTSTRVNA